MYKPKNFEIYELVSPWVYQKRGEKAWQLFDENALRLLQALRDEFGSLVVNDWKWGGKFSQSGLRDKDHYGTAKKYHDSFSQHKYGRAFDCKFKNHTAEEVRQYLKDNWEEFCKKYDLDFCVTLEEDTSWTHVDTRWQEGDKQLYSFKP